MFLKFEVAKVVKFSNIIIALFFINKMHPIILLSRFLLKCNFLSQKNVTSNFNSQIYSHFDLAFVLKTKEVCLKN